MQPPLTHLILIDRSTISVIAVAIAAVLAWLSAVDFPLVLGVLGLAAPFLAPLGRRQPLAVMAEFSVGWYFAHEISPLKPYPDFARYMVPLAPILLILGAASINESLERYRAGTGAIVATLALLAAAVPAAWISLRINVRADDDPRRLLREIVANAPNGIAVDGYAAYGQAPFLAELDGMHGCDIELQLRSLQALRTATATIQESSGWGKVF
jgi:hypothetical protein